MYLRAGFCVRVCVYIYIYKIDNMDAVFSCKVCRVPDKAAVGNSWYILHTILGRKQSSSVSSNPGHMKGINPKFTTKSDFYDICVFQTFDLDLDLVSE